MNWQKIREEYEPRVVKTTTDAQLYAILQEMINRLNRSHFFIIPPEVYKAIETAKIKAKSGAISNSDDAEDSDGNAKENEEEDATEDDSSAKYGIGVELRIIENKVVITNIEQNSAADIAGLKTGYIIEKVNGVLLEDLIKRLRSLGSYSKLIEKQLPLEIAAGILDGEKDSSVKLVVIDENEEPKDFEIERKKLNGKLTKIGPNIPEQFLKYESKSLNEDVGYIKFNYFATAVIEKICSSIGDFKNKKAVIIDLRGNLGGSVGSMFGITGMFTDRDISIGTQIFKVGSENTIVRRQPKHFSGKIVILVDGLSHSAAEIFAAALQENGRAEIVGDRSAGEALPALTIALPTGAYFLYPIANFKTPKGNLIEGKGVEPNILIALDRKSLLAGKDNQLNAAQNIAETKTAEKSEPEKTAAAKNPPPPKPIAKIDSAKTVAPNVVKKQDAKALAIFDDFIKAVGGAKALESLSSYSAKGKVLINRGGAKIEGDLEIYRQSPNKYAEIYKIDGIGETKEAFNGEHYFVQSSFDGIKEFENKEQKAEVKLYADFYEILRAKEIYPHLEFQGEFDRLGRKTNLIEAETTEGTKVFFVFDAETKFLTARSSKYTGASYGDYRKVEGVYLPFAQNRNSNVLLNITEFKLNAPIDESKFDAQKSCFERVD